MTIAYTDFQHMVDGMLRGKVMMLSMDEHPRQAMSEIDFEDVFVLELALVSPCFRSDARGYCVLAWWYWYLSRFAAQFRDSEVSRNFWFNFAFYLLPVGLVALYKGQLMIVWGVIGAVIYALRMAFTYNQRAQRFLAVFFRHVGDFQATYWSATPPNQHAIQCLSNMQSKWFREKLFSPYSQARLVEEVLDPW